MNYYFQIGDYVYDLKNVTEEKRTDEEFKGLSSEAVIYTLTRSSWANRYLTPKEKQRYGLAWEKEKDVFVAIICGDTSGDIRDDKGFCKAEDKKIFESFDERISLAADKLAIKRIIKYLER